MFATQTKQKGLSLRMNDFTGGRAFKGDRTRLQQILMNLVSNAVKFTEKGEIQISVEAEEQESGQWQLVIAVRDTGIGIPAEKLPFIFDKFTQADETITRRFGGSGLGLSIARSLAQLMGGNITVETEMNAGSIFTLTIAMQAGNSASIIPVPRPVEEQRRHSGGTVLLVEDYAANIMVASLMIEDLGFAVVTAESGAQALDIVRSTKTPFLAILMDVQMYGMDGLETTRRIREMERQMGMHHTIIGVTAHVLAGDRERCLAAGMDDYISKPIHPDILAAKLTHLADKAA